MSSVIVKQPFVISGYGMYLPDEIETSKELSSKINKTEDWIISRTGVVERRISSIDVDKMGAIAAEEAIGDKSQILLLMHQVSQNRQSQIHLYLFKRN